MLAGCGAFGDSPTSNEGPRPEGQAIRVGLPTGVTSFANADLAVAIEKGFLSDVGLTVETQNLRSGVSVVQGVVGGALEIGASSIEPVVNAAAGGGDVAIIGAYTDKLTVSSVAPAEVQTAADLRGRQVGVQEVGAFREVMTRLVLQSAGLTQNDVSYIPVDAQSYNSALVDGRIQNAILQTEQAIAVQRDHPGFHSIAELSNVVPDYHYGTFLAAGQPRHRGQVHDGADPRPPLHVREQGRDRQDRREGHRVRRAGHRAGLRLPARPAGRLPGQHGARQGPHQEDHEPHA
jgi:ABC-type nitrate/sulfonate/bicarbonate transport system substrate-binding protein